MGRGLVIGKRRIRFRFFIFMFLLIISCYYMLKSLSRSPVYAIVQYGEISLSDTGDALVIRQENVYEAPEYGKVTFFVAEGDKVNKEDPVAVLYKANYKEELVYQLYNVQEKILSYQQENILQEVMDKDLQRIDREINNTVMSVQTAIRDEQLSGLDNMEKTLRSLFVNRQKVLDQKMAPDPYIEKLYREEAELNKQLEEWKVELVAPESGFISFSLDGMEDILGIKAVNYIAVKDFKNFYGKEVLQKDDGQAKAAQPFFRIVEPGKWYAACLIHDPQMTYEKGQEVDVSFLGTQINKIQGKVYRVAQEKEGSIVIIEFNDNVEQFINCRSIRVEISKKFQGFMVPADAVVSRQGERGVRIVRGDSNAFIAVNVVASDDESAIIEEKGGLKEIELHTKVLIERR